MLSDDREEDRVYRGSVRQITVRKVTLFDLTCRVLAPDDGFKAKLFVTKCYSNETAKENHTDLYCCSTFDPKMYRVN